MRLAYLKIHHFKNLNYFNVDFDETSEEPVTVLLGRNGSGKSNLFEALIIIFRDLIQGKTANSFGYELLYTLRGGKVAVHVCNPPSVSDLNGTSNTVFVGKKSEAITSFTFTVKENGEDRRIAKKEIRSYLPRYVVTYYSGVSNRMELTLPSERVAHRRTGFGLSSGLG